MSLRDRINPQQLLAVSLALIMLVSMGGMAFVGGVGAQTGGTYDQVFDESDDIGADLNVGSNQVLAVGPDGDDDVDVTDDGAVNVDATGTEIGEFVGVELTPDRIAELSGVSADPATAPATFLDEAPAEFDTGPAAGSTTSAVFIEYAPQSNFSQITGNLEDVDGSHDFIVVAPEGAQIDGLVDTDATSNNNADIENDEVVALSVDNNGADTGAAASTLLASESDYGAVFDQLVGESDSDLQNENVDDFQYVAGTFDSDTTLEQVRLGDDVSTFADGQTVHSEKITLVDAEDDSERYFNTISNADQAADAGDTIRLDDGSYDAPVDLATDGLTVQPDASGDDPTVSGEVEYSAANVTVDGLEITDSVTDAGDGVESPTLTNSIVDESGLNTGVNFSASDNATVTNNTITAQDLSLSDGDTGIDVSNGFETVAHNDIQDFETQIAATASEDMDALLADNAFADNSDSQAAVAFNETAAVQGANIYGSINETDNVAASPDDTIRVYGGTYDHNRSVNISTENVSFFDVEDNATIENTVNLNADTTPDGDVSVSGFTINGDLATTTSNAGTVVVADTVANNFDFGTIAEVTLKNTTGGDYTADGDTVSITDADGRTYDVTAPNATLEGVTADATLDGGAADIAIDIDATGNGDIVVANSTVTTDGNNGGINVDTDTDVAAEESVTVTDNTVTGNANFDGATAAVTITDIVTATDGNDYVVEDNSLTALEDGQAVRLIEDDDATSQNEEEELGSVRVIENEMRGGTDFTGLYYDLPETTSAAIEGNVIVGADVAGGDDSVGVEFSEVLDFGSGGIFGSGDALTFEDNVITGHAQLVADTGADDRTVLGSDYTAMYNNSELNNSFGTLVAGPDHETYSDTFDITSDIYANVEADTGDGRTYLPGSVSEAADLVADSDEADSQTVDLEVQTINTSVGGPTVYDDDAPVTVPDREAITISGEEDTVTVETRLEILSSTNENNHDISDLTIVNDNGGAAIDVNSENAQSDFDNLHVTSDGTGLDVDTTGDDVNVINVTNSEFSVDASGIVLATGADDRDGFVIDNVEIDGPSIGGDDVGIDLDGVEKPGKDGLPVDLQVTETKITNFETLVAVDDSGLDVEANNFLTSLTQPTDIQIADNEFDRAVTVDEGSDNLYGSVDLAASNAADDATVTVQGEVQGDTAPEYDHEGVVTVDTTDVTIAGENNPTIADGIDVTVGGVAIETLAIDADGDYLAPSDYDEDAIIDSDTGALTVDSVTVTSTISSSINDMPIGVAATGGSLTVDGSTIGETSGTTGTGIAVADGVTLAVTDSTLTGGVDGDDNGATPAYGIDAADNTAPDIDSTTITDFEQAGVWVADDALSITDGEISDNGAAGVTDNGVTNASAQYDIDGTVIENNAGDGVALEEVGLTLTDATVDANTNGVIVSGADDVTVTNATVTANTGDDAAGIDVTDGNATVTDSTITANDVGVALDLADASNSSVTLNEIANNGDGLVIADGADELTVTGNDFANDATDIENADDATLDGTLNYFGTAQGPASDAAAGVTDNVVYDPFLTEDQTDSTISDITETRDFGHDVVIPAESTVSVGFPAEPNPERNQISDVFSEDTQGTLYKWNAEDDQFEAVSASTFENDEVDAFDGYVVDNQGETETALIEYQNERSALDTSRNAFEYEKGLNFVPAQQAGTVNRALFPGGDTDYVAQPFTTGENLYGDTDATQTRDTFTSPSADGFGGNFRSGVGSEEVHPHAAYLVIVNEDSNDGLTVTERIPAPDAPTVDNVDERTSSTISTVTNVQTGATYDSLAPALDEVQDGQTLELGSGVFEDGFEQTVTNDDVTLRGAGDTATTIEDDLTIEGENVRLRGINVVGTLTLNGDGTTLNQLDVTANSPGDVVVNANNVQLDDVDAEGDVSINGDNAQVQNTRAGGTLSTAADTTTTFGGTVSARTYTLSGTTNTEGGSFTEYVETSPQLIDAAAGNGEFGDNVAEIIVADDIDLSSSAVVSVDGVTVTSDTGSESVTLDAADGTPALAVDADDVTVDDLTVERTGSGSTVAQAVRVAGSDVTLTDNTYSATGTNDAAVAVLTDSSGAAGNPDVSGETFDNIEISGGEIGSSATGLLVADNGAATFADGAVNVADVSFADNADHVLALDTGGNVVDTDAVLADNSFDKGVSVDDVDEDRDGFSVDALLTSSVQSAVDAAATDATVSISEATYDESVTVDTEGVTLEAADGASPTIRFAPSAVDGTPTISVTADNTSVQGLTVERVAADGRSSEGSHAQGIRVDASNVVISDNVVTGDRETENNRFDGIVVLDTDSSTTQNVTITGNDVTGFYGGVTITTYYGGGIDSVDVNGNTIGSNAYGIVAKTHTGSNTQPMNVDLSGGNTFNDNTEEDVYLSNGSNFQGYTDMGTVDADNVTGYSESN
ncbi:right-handed parallel beta-helix repeat-containing protein [Halorubrum sp. Ea8]|uniref:beta strand repeat-containing protein n=1 Tax=Halorubrum sp. Ea8 TaxID=1383841 RepID=UPI000B9886DA|nr:right-handed parallel beta-helix repeat-containing protein [Halorubrum sp. Ea8]OYR52924.1 hypothetical protein DJ74_00335 [Halorubrum sp. Ea8]